MEDKRWFQINWSRSKTQNCYECKFSEFDESKFYTPRDIKAIDQLKVGETWYDPDKDLTDKHKKSWLRVRRLK